jgi:ABC-type dipeptide/oligopeptide/nickel transport system permease subunit
MIGLIGQLLTLFFGMVLGVMSGFYGGPPTDHSAHYRVH